VTPRFISPSPSTLVRALALAVVLLGAAARASGEPRRYAVLVGFNHGDAADVTLRYAEADARRLERVLRTVGGFHAEDIAVITEGGASDVRRALVELNARLRQESREALLFVFYSGHADAESLHLAGSRLSTQELRALVAGSAATARVMVIDACRSGVVTRIKGGRVAPSFDVRLEQPLAAEGLAIITSSAAGEDSQESDQLGASFFTHFFASALIGAGDRNGDGSVTLNEAFNYASERTLAATAATLAGPQHPTYRLELGGRDDLVLTRPGAAPAQLGQLAFAEPGWYLVARGGVVVAELHTDAPAGRLTLEAGRYRITRRSDDHLDEGEFMVAAGGTGEVRTAGMRRIDYARVVRKGGSLRRSSLSLMAFAGARGELLGLGTAWRVEAAARLDLPQLSLELRLGTGRAELFPNSGDTLWELQPSLTVMRALDLGRVTLAVGPTVGVAWLRQTVNDAQTTNSSAFVFGAVGQVQVGLWGRWFLVGDVALLEYVARHADEGGGRLELLTTYRAVAGVGGYL
jgi:hypothetical protein